jgi:hypothetical protein
MAREEDRGKLTPIVLVSREISSNVSMTEAEVSSAIQRLMWRCLEEVSSAIQTDPLSSYAEERSLEYRALAEMVVAFGSTLAALDDMEEYELSAGRDTARIA